MHRAVILTALRVEYLAVRAHLDAATISEVTHARGTVYEEGEFHAPDRRWQVAIAEIGAGNETAAFEIERAIAAFEPAVALFVGVAGGIKDVALGDVVFATKVYGYEHGKSEQTFRPRPSVGESSYGLEQRARAEARRVDWLNRIDSVPQNMRPQALVGAIAAGAKVVASTRSSVARFLRKQYGDSLAVEMEGRGFLGAIRANRSVEAGIVRSISDLIDEKQSSDAAGFQDVASAHAAAFAFQLLANFEPEAAREVRRDVSLAGSRVRYAVVLSGTFDETGVALARAFYATLKSRTGDASLELSAVVPGSIQLVLTGSFLGYQRLAVLHRTGQLEPDGKKRVEQVRLLETLDANEPNVVRWKASEAEERNWEPLVRELTQMTTRLLSRRRGEDLLSPEEAVNEAIARYLASGAVAASTNELRGTLTRSIESFVRARTRATGRSYEPVEALDFADFDARNDSEQQLIANDLTRRAAESLSSPALRRVFELILDGHDSAAIGRELDVQPSTVVRLRRKLKKELAAWADLDRSSSKSS